MSICCQALIKATQQAYAELQKLKAAQHQLLNIFNMSINKDSYNSSLTDYFDFLVSHGGQQLSKAIHLWKAGVDHESNFWTWWFENKGYVWPEDFVARTRPTPLLPGLAKLLPDPQESGISTILDVGSGPVTKIGTYLPGREISVIACDPLSHVYDMIIERSGVNVPLRTIFSFVEDLSARFEESSFDVVSCVNALDHSIEPAWGILEMLMVAKIGGFLFLSHRCNEAEHENYVGMHQWNLDMIGADFIIWNKERKININELTRGFAEVQCRLTGAGPESGIVVFIKKTNDMPIDSTTYNRRLRAVLLDALIAEA